MKMFIVEGADKETGEARTERIYARTANDAERLAGAQRRIAVSKVTEEEPRPWPPSPPPEKIVPPLGSRRKPAVVDVRGTVGLTCAIGVGIVLGNVLTMMLFSCLGVAVINGGIGVLAEMLRSVNEMGPKMSAPPVVAPAQPAPAPAKKPAQPKPDERAIPSGWTRLTRGDAIGSALFFRLRDAAVDSETGQGAAYITLLETPPRKHIVRVRFIGKAGDVVVFTSPPVHVTLMPDEFSIPVTFEAPMNTAHGLTIEIEWEHP